MANSKEDNILNEIKLLHDYLSMQMKRIKKSKEKKKKNHSILRKKEDFKISLDIEIII